MFRAGGRAGRVKDEHERFTGRGWMSASSSELKFVIFREVKDGYRLCGVLRQGSSSNPLARSSPDHRGAFQAALKVFVTEERALVDLGA